MTYSANARPLSEAQITEAGNPAKPQGECGALMLERMNRSHEEVTNWALDLLSFSPDQRVLDVGCGGGATMGRISQRMGKGSGTVVGVDYSEVSCAQSRELNAAGIASGRMEVRQASVEALPFADTSFDVVTTVESFYFWPDPVANLAEVARVLKPGGRFLLVADVYQKDGLAQEVLDNIRRRSLTVLTPSQHEDLLLEAGFSLARAHLKEGTDWIAVEGLR